MSETYVDVEGRQLKLTNLEKVLYPEAAFTKAEVIDYYARIAPVMLPHLEGRCITLRRWPDGVEGTSFFEKRCPSHRPEWLGVALGPGDRRGGREGERGGGLRRDRRPCVAHRRAGGLLHRPGERGESGPAPR